MTNAEKVVLRYPNETYVEIVGDQTIVKQILERLDNLEITVTTTSGFFVKEQTNDGEFRRVSRADGV